MAAGLGFKTFTTGEVLTAADTNGYLMQGILVFASAAARDSAITSPQEGQFAYLKDTNVTTYYTGSAWANVDTTGMTNPMTTTGDTIYSSSGSTPARLGIGSTGQVLTVAAGVPSWATPAGAGATYALFRDEKSSGTQGGTATSGAFRTRDLNTSHYNTISGASLSSNQVTLPAGTFYIHAVAPERGSNSVLRWYNITDSALSIAGQSNYYETWGESHLMGFVTTAGSKTFELQQRFNITEAGNGLGVGPNFGQNEVYAMVSIVKVA
jgi:hypothetical protein